MSPDLPEFDEISQANRDAWEKAHQVVQAWRRTQPANVTHLPWQEISYQLRCNGDFVDLTTVPPYWLSESPQMAVMRQILEAAGFQREDECYYWPPAE